MLPIFLPRLTSGPDDAALHARSIARTLTEEAERPQFCNGCLVKPHIDAVQTAAARIGMEAGDIPWDAIRNHGRDAMPGLRPQELVVVDELQELANSQGPWDGEWICRRNEEHLQIGLFTLN